MLVLSITKDKEGILLKNLDNNSTCMINIADKSKIKYVKLCIDSPKNMYIGRINLKKEENK
jgi:hypothetical protein